MMVRSGDDRFRLDIPIKWEIVLFIAIFGLAVFLRFFDLSADPPAAMATSTGIETDPPQYTIYARHEQLAGNWNPYNDNRYITYEYSLVSGLSRVVFALFGIGTYQANLVGVILSLCSIFLFYLIIRKTAGNGVALLTLFFVGVNYIAIFYGRRSFLENGMILLLILGLFFLTYLERRWIGHFLFGLFLAAAIFFGKIIGLAFLGIPIVYYGYKALVLRTPGVWKQAAAMLAAFLLLSGGWYIFLYMPYAHSLHGYVKEQAFGLYGYPEAFTSVAKFIWKFMIFGIKDGFFDRMPAICIASLAFGMLLSSRLFNRDRSADWSHFNNLILLSLIAWPVGVYLLHMPWNYQTLRYLTSMIFPLSALAALLIAYLYNLKTPVNLLNRSLGFIITSFILLSLLVYQITRAIVVDTGGLFTFVGYIYFIAGAVLIVCLVYLFVSRKKRKTEAVLPNYLRFSLIGLIIIISVFYQAKNYMAWARVPIYTMRQASRDLGMVLSPGAVISGPYGPVMAMDNKLGCIIHFFGTSRPDPDLFKKFPVTHLAVDDANEQVARKIYPEIMEKALYVCNYNINTDMVTIFNIASSTGNPEAARYKLSEYEWAAYYYAAKMPDSAITHLRTFLDEYPNCIIGNNQAGIYFMVIENFKNAVYYFSKALENSETDFKLHFFLGNAYIGLADKTGDNSFREKGEAEIELARKYGLGKFALDEYLIDSPKDRENGKTDEKP